MWVGCMALMTRPLFGQRKSHFSSSWTRPSRSSKLPSRLRRPLIQLRARPLRLRRMPLCPLVKRRNWRRRSRSYKPSGMLKRLYVFVVSECEGGMLTFSDTMRTSPRSTGSMPTSLRSKPSSTQGSRNLRARRKRRTLGSQNYKRKFRILDLDSTRLPPLLVETANPTKPSLMKLSERRCRSGKQNYRRLSLSRLEPVWTRRLFKRL